MRKSFVLLFMISWFTLPGTAQNLIRQDMYFRNMNFMNAAAGLEDTTQNNDLQLYFIHKFVPNKTWTKAPNAMLNYIRRIDRIGGSINAGYVYDNYSFADRHTFQVGYAAHLHKGRHFFDLGARAVINYDHFRDKSVHESPDVNGLKNGYVLPDLDLGFQYRFEGLTFGISAKNLFKNHIRRTVDLFENERIIYSNISYTHSFGKNVALSVFTLPSYSSSFQVDVGLAVGLWKKIDIAYLFRLKELRHVYRLSAAVNENIYMGISVSHSQVYSDLTGNFMIGYRF